MQAIFQSDEFGCGIACVAMLCGITYAKAKKLFGADYIPGYGVDEAPMINILAHQGLDVVRRGRLSQSRPVTQLRQKALLWGQLLPSRGAITHSNKFGHWCIWDSEAKVVRDPYHYNYKKPLWLTSFYEIGAGS